MDGKQTSIQGKTKKNESLRSNEMNNESIDNSCSNEIMEMVKMDRTIIHTIFSHNISLIYSFIGRTRHFSKYLSWNYVLV